MASHRIVVTGLAATYPFGGVFWDYAQYTLGFHRLGHDVLYLEDTGKWVYDPTAQTFTDNATVSIDTVAPRIGGRPDRTANTNGWYAGDVTVGFRCRDSLSGIASRAKR